MSASASRQVFKGEAPRRHTSERFPHKPHVPAKLAGARVVLFTPRKHRERSANSVYLCVLHRQSASFWKSQQK
jgi:hypothetical protein